MGIMATKKAIEAVCRRLGYTVLKLEHEKAFRSFVNGQKVFESLTMDREKFECQ